MPLGPYLKSGIDHDDGVVTLRLVGEFDMAAAQAFRELLTRLEAAAPRAVVIDLAAVTFLDSSGGRALIDAYERSLGTHALVVVDGGHGHRTLRLMGIDQLLTVVSSLDELDAAPATRHAEATR